MELKLEDFVKYMPNLLEFENKRQYFLKEMETKKQ